MILQALKEYYDRKPDLPREGWEMKAIPFLVVINENGDFVDFQDTREGEGKQMRAKEFLVPALGEKKGNGIKANLFWENIEYLFGIPVVTEKKPQPNKERVLAQHTAFKKKIETISGDCLVLQSVKSFLSKTNPQQILANNKWEEVKKLKQSLLIAIANKGPVTDDLELRSLIDASRPLCGKKGRCLVTGLEDEIVALEPPIRGVRGASTMGASLVAVNNKVTNGSNAGAVPAFASFMKEQGFNSPIGKTASFAYSTALNSLMKRDSRQLVHIGDSTVVFWSEKNTALEQDAFYFFSEPYKDDPARNTEAMKSLYSSIWNGSYVIDDDNTRFYVLGLSPNSARISVRFWQVATVKEMGVRLKQHIDDLSIVHGDKMNPALPLRRLLRSLAAQEEEKNISPNLAGETIRSILGGLPYPSTMLSASVRRIRSEQAKKSKNTGKSEPNVTYERAAIIKACLNRSGRFNNNKQEVLNVSLDINNTNVGYRLGRLFATLEKIQQEASPGINATIRDKFYSSASGTPVTVFGNLMRLKNHHLAKLENQGRRVNLERLIGQIVDGLTDFPSHLTLDDQGRFAIGYYHQMQDFFTKKSE